MVIRLGKENSGKLERYCRANRGKEWVCIIIAGSWYIYSREALINNHKKWKCETWCGSWANMHNKWEELTGQKITYNFASVRDTGESIRTPHVRETKKYQNS